MADIGATMEEISGCLAAEGPRRCQEGEEDLSGRALSLSTDTPTSLTMSISSNTLPSVHLSPIVSLTLCTTQYSVNS